METIKISESKFKITLERSDMQRYELSVPIDVISAGEQVRLRRILREICEEQGICADPCRVFVQIYESVDGGCELFVTQYGNYSGEREMAAPRITIPRQKNERGIYKFRDLDSLLAVCERLSKPGRAGSSAYMGHEGGYYLITYEPESRIDAICGEYGGVRCGKRTTMAFLSEHCDCICSGDAVGTLGALA